MTCYIAVPVLSIGTELYTFSYEMYQFQRDITDRKICNELFRKFVYESLYFIIIK